MWNSMPFSCVCVYVGEGGKPESQMWKIPLMKHRRKDENNYYYNCYTSDIFAISLLLKKKKQMSSVLLFAGFFIRTKLKRLTNHLLKGLETCENCKLHITISKKRCWGERRLDDRNELWVPFGMQTFTSCVGHAYVFVASENQAL